MNLAEVQAMVTTAKVVQKQTSSTLSKIASEKAWTQAQFDRITNLTISARVADEAARTSVVAADTALKAIQDCYKLVDSFTRRSYVVRRLTDLKTSSLLSRKFATFIFELPEINYKMNFLFCVWVLIIVYLVFTGTREIQWTRSNR